MGTAREQISQGLENLCLKDRLFVGDGLTFLLTVFVAFSLVLNVLVAFSAFDGSRMLAQLAEEHGVPVERLGVGAPEHFAAVRDRYEHTAQGTMLYCFEFTGGQWAAVSIAAALVLSWMWRRRGLLIAFAPLVINIALLAIVFAHWAAVSRIAAYLE